MKKLLTFALLSILFLSGCDIVDETKKLGDDLSNSYDKAATEAQKTIEEVKEAKAKIEETVNDLNNAKDKIKEATNAIGEIAK